MNTQITPTFSTTKTAAVNTLVHAPLWIHMRISTGVKTRVEFQNKRGRILFICSPEHLSQSTVPLALHKGSCVPHVPTLGFVKLSNFASLVCRK